MLTRATASISLAVNPGVAYTASHQGQRSPRRYDTFVVTVYNKYKIHVLRKVSFTVVRETFPFKAPSRTRWLATASFRIQHGDVKIRQGACRNVTHKEE